MNTQDEIYIATLKEQINGGMYDHLFTTGRRISCGEAHPQYDTYHPEGHPEFKKDLVFLDIGANIGLVSIYAVPYCKRIVSVEPALETWKQLMKNTKDYAIIGVDQSALSPEDRLVDFYENDLNFTASSTVNTYGTKTTVRGRTLMSILDRNYLTHVDVCKCDAEGSEGESLSLDQLEKAKNIIQQWFIEFHNCPKTSWEHKLGTTVANLARLGYHKQTIDGMSLTASK